MWLPNWPTLRLKAGQDGPDKPFATVETRQNRRLLTAVCPQAADAGLAEGMTLAQARAILPTLEVAEADPAGDAAGLAALAAWAERYSPLTAADPPDGLWLDIAGCAHFFGGEAALLSDLATRLSKRGLSPRMAVADAAGAAWALARAATRSACTVLPAGAEKAALDVLPVALLRLEPRTVAGLRRVGLKSVGELARQPRGEITARFGPLPMQRLDQAYGTAAEAIAWRRPPAPWEERLAFAEPIGTPESLAQAIDTLARRLCSRLEAEVAGAHRFTASFLRVDNERPSAEVAFSLPARDPAALLKLFTEKLPGINPGFGVDAVILAAEGVAKLRPPQRLLADLANPVRADLAASVDALANRLGGDRLWRDAPHASHVPERAVHRLPPLAPCPAWEHDPDVERPIRLFSRPEPIEATAPVPDDPPILFRWRGAVHRVRAASGPERIAAEWWRGQGEGTREPADLVRDYYRVEDSAGARFWLFRTGRHAGAPGTGWFLHGLFG